MLDRFTELCRDEDLRPSEAVEEFMRRSIEIRSVTEALNLIVNMEPKAVLSRELRARAIVSDLTGAIKDEEFFWENYHEKYRQYHELLGMIPSLKDPQLIEEIQALTEKVNKFLSGEESHTV